MLRWDPINGTTEEVVGRTEAATPQGVAVAPNGDVFFSEYGTMEPAVADPSGHGSLAGIASKPGGIKVKRAANGVVSVVASGLWRCRGIALDPVRGQLYVSSEANAWDQGSSGSIHRWDWATGQLELVVAGLDYPQFPQWTPLKASSAGGLVVTLARHNLVLLVTPPTDSLSHSPTPATAARRSSADAQSPLVSSNRASMLPIRPPESRLLGDGANWTSAGGEWTRGAVPRDADTNLTVVISDIVLTVRWQRRTHTCAHT